MAAEPSANRERRYHCIGKYEVVAHIATGGMGVIYRALDTETGEEVALKVLSPMLAAKGTALKRFRAEARRGEKLRHENLVTIHDFGEANGVYFLVLEYVDGIDLHEYIQDHGRLDPNEALPLMNQAARALEYLYQEHVVHRDVKPSNFLVSQTDAGPRLQLTDLGLALQLDDQEFRITRAGNTVGTIDYMSPEQARDSRAADIRSDIYSLGCTFYHMLAGRPPFPEGGLTERLYKHLEEEPPDPRRFNRKVSPELSKILARMLAKKPDDRYQTPGELLRELARLGPDEPWSAAPEPVWDNNLVEETPAPGAAHHGGDAVVTQESWPALSSDSALVPSVGLEQRRAAAGQFARAHEVLAVGNYDYGIHLLLSCCKLDPGALKYRKTLRRIERLKYGNKGAGGRFAWLTTLVARTRFKASRQAGDHLKVLAHGEDVLARNPWDIPTHIEMSEAAEELGLTKLAIWLLEQAWHKDTHTLELNRALARLYEQRGFLTEAATLWNLVLRTDPADLVARQKVSDLAARETIVRGQYEELVDGHRERPAEKKS